MPGEDSSQMKSIKPPRATTWWRRLAGNDNWRLCVHNKAKHCLNVLQIYVNGVTFLHVLLQLALFIHHYIFYTYPWWKKCSSNSYEYIHFNCFIVFHHFTTTSNTAMNRFMYTRPIHTSRYKNFAWVYTWKCVCWVEIMSILTLLKYWKITPYNYSSFYFQRPSMKASPLSDTPFSPQLMLSELKTLLI